MVINTECVVHDANEARRYQKMNIDSSPPKQKVGYSFHMGDVKTLTQHILDEDDETELDELTLVRFFDGEAVPVTESYEELNKKFNTYHAEHDSKLDKILEKQDK